METYLKKDIEEERKSMSVTENLVNMKGIDKENGKSMFVTFRAKRSDSALPDIKRFTTREQVGLRKKQILSVLLIWVVTTLLVIWVVTTSSYIGMDKWDRVVYIGMMFMFFHLILTLDNFNLFHDFHRGLEGICNGRGQMVFGMAFLVLGFVDYILIGIYYDLLNEEGPLGLYIALYILYYLCLILMFFNFMVYWEVIAFYCSEYSYVHGFMYISILGGFVLFFARWIRPSKPGDWHHHPGTSIVLDGILNVISLFFVFLVLLAGIGIPLFAEFGQSAKTLGTPLAFTLLAIVSMCVMLTPLAPGNIVDVCGGFVMIQILMKQERLGFYVSWLIAYFAICILHVCGACAQWFIGKQPCVQAWGNASLPIPMLAASDAVLKEANWFRVGLIGCVFMDTANGLNQGRINMEFWTQLFSEWVCFPNAIPLVSVGGTVAVSGINSLNWTRMALPVLLLLASVWQAMGTSFGANAMGSSTDTDKYWQSREKWTLTQFFNRVGYTVTRSGWKNDVYQLAKTDQEIYSGDGNKNCLYSKIVKLHKVYIKDRDTLQTEQERLARYQRYNDEITVIREDHINNIKGNLESAAEAGWLIFKEIRVNTVSCFNKEENLKYKSAIIFVLNICFLVSVVGIYNEIEMQEAVILGIKVLNKVSTYAWVSFGLFIFLQMVYHNLSIVSGLKSTGSMIAWILGGCKFTETVETKFDTPQWEMK